jgi:hypothetical protein
MSKIAEKKALEVYPPENGTLYQRLGYVKGYDQAIQDMVKDSDHFEYLSDEMGYAYACGCRKTKQDFMGKVEEWIRYEWSNKEVADLMFNSFKKYLQDESEK